MDVRDVVRVREVRVGGKSLLGVEVSLPNSPPLVILIGEKGFAMCGFLDIQVAEKLGVVAARVPGVKSVEDMLGKEIASVTSKARELGLVNGVRLLDVADKL